MHGRDELWLQKHGDGHGGAPTPRPATPTPRRSRPSTCRRRPTGRILLALALTFMLAGLLISTYQIIAGGLLVLYCMFKFALEYHRPAQEAH